MIKQREGIIPLPLQKGGFMADTKKKETEKKFKLNRIDKKVLELISVINHPTTRDEIAEYPSFLAKEMEEAEKDLIQISLDKMAKDGTYLLEVRDGVYGITDKGLLKVYKG